MTKNESPFHGLLEITKAFDDNLRQLNLQTINFMQMEGVTNAVREIQRYMRNSSILSRFPGMLTAGTAKDTTGREENKAM